MNITYIFLYFLSLIPCNPPRVSITDNGFFIIIIFFFSARIGMLFCRGKRLLSREVFTAEHQKTFPLRLCSTRKYSMPGLTWSFKWRKWHRIVKSCKAHFSGFVCFFIPLHSRIRNQLQYLTFYKMAYILKEKISQTTSLSSKMSGNT